MERLSPVMHSLRQLSPGIGTVNGLNAFPTRDHLRDEIYKENLYHC